MSNTSRRVALVHEWLTIPAGSEEVFSEMCQLFPGTVFGSIIDSDRCKFLQGMDLRPSFLQNFPLAKHRYYWYTPLMPAAFRRMNLSEFDLVLSSNHSFAHSVRKRPDALHICYYHTPARWLWVPEIDNRATKSPIHRMIARYLKPLDLEASKHPDYLLANSETTAARLKKFYGRDTYRVIHPPVRTQLWSDVQRQSEDLGFLYWGRLIDYKKVDLLIEAVRQTGDKLQIVGSGPIEDELKAQAAGMANVTFHGRLPDDELKKVMANCRAVLFAAYEDFGIVPVEAMAAGLPVVTYGVGGASESVLPEFGVQFPEQTADSVAEGIRALAGRSFDPAALKAHAAGFDVEVFRKRYQETVEELYARHIGA